METIQGKPINNFDARVMVGARLLNIEFGYFSTQIHFDNEATISMEDSFLYTNKDGVAVEVACARVSATQLCESIHAVVLSAALNENGSFALSFDDGISLTFLKRLFPESYSIKTISGTFVA